MERHSIESPVRLTFGVMFLGVPITTVLLPDCQCEPTTVLSPEPRREPPSVGTCSAYDGAISGWSSAEFSLADSSLLDSLGSSMETRLDSTREALPELLDLGVGLVHDVLLEPAQLLLIEFMGELFSDWFIEPRRDPDTGDGVRDCD